MQCPVPTSKQQYLSSFYRIIFTLAFILPVITSFKLASHPVNIKGHLKKNPADTSADINAVTVFVKADDKKLAEAVTNDKGDFEMSFTAGDEKSFDFYCSAAGIDTLLIASFKHFESDTPEITFFIPGERKKNLLGKIICPKCKKADKVYTIVYEGSGSDKWKAADEKEERPSPGKPAKYYCERDKVEF